MLQKLIPIALFGYDIKLIEEMAWAGVVGAATVALQLLVATDPSKVDNWHTWAVAAGAALARAFVAAAFGNPPPPPPPPPTPPGTPR